jgi:hypothetical protein
MKGERHPARLAVAEAREAVLERLSAAFTHDQRRLEELEGRVDAAYQATSEPGLQALLKDLAPPPSPARAALAPTPAALAALQSVPRSLAPKREASQ